MGTYCEAFQPVVIASTFAMLKARISTRGTARMGQLRFIASSPDSSPRREVDGEGAEPVAAFVMLAGHCCETCFAVRSGGGAQCLDARVAVHQAGGDALQHPGTAEVESVEMGQLRIAAIGHDRGVQPVVRAVDRDIGEERPEPDAVWQRGQD